MSKEKIEIKALSETPGFAPILAHWSYMQWYRRRSLPFDAILQSYQNRARGSGMPFTYVATVNTEPAGMASLKNDDLWSRKDLNPWLSSLYVIPEFRRCGIGNLLIGAVLEKARECRVNVIFLFLGQEEKERLKEYYEKRCWRLCESAVDNDGMETEIYSLKV